MSYEGISSCKCGKVQFEMKGAPLMAPNCCCNDCVVSAKFIDEKAKNAGTENISNVLVGNDQTAAMVMWPSSGIKLIKGKEYIVKYKLRDTSTVYRAYTSCCNTVVVACTGEGLPTLSIGIPYNRQTLQPPVDATFFANTGEIPNKDSFPKNDIKIPFANTIPAGALCGVIGAACFGGGACKDNDTLIVLGANGGADVEVVGAEFYKKCGYELLIKA